MTRTNFILGKVILAMTLAGWLVLSNHCALGRMAQTSHVNKEHACCQNADSKPNKGPADEKQGPQCCKSLRALVPNAGNDGTLTPPAVLIAILPALRLLEAQAGAPPVVASATGPPARVASFSELVLHRSLRAHAPPCLA